MCMENINAVTSVASINNKNEIIRMISEVDQNTNIIPVNKEKQASIMVSFLSTIINGKNHFFDEYEHLTIQLRITDDTNTDRIDLIEYEIDLKDGNNYYNTNYVDFRVENHEDIFNLDLTNLHFQHKHFLAILVKHPKMKTSDWIIQSATPLKFQLEGADNK